MAIVAVGAAGCGTESRENKNRPPVPVNISADIGTLRVSVSPEKFGAGPTRITLTNQSGVSARMKVTGDALTKSLGTIKDRTAAQVEVDLPAGTYDVVADADRFIEPATIVVGKERPTSQNDLLLP